MRYPEESCIDRIDMRPFRTAQRGVTLIELMIVIAIVALLAAIAYPSYENYVTRSHRQAAKNILYRRFQYTTP